MQDQRLPTTLPTIISSPVGTRVTTPASSDGPFGALEDTLLAQGVQETASKRHRPHRWETVWPMVVLMVLLALWSTLATEQPSSILPGPWTVCSRFVEAWRDGTYLPAFGATLEEAALGWALGTAVALPLGYIVGRWRILEVAVTPYLAASQAMPVVAVAPLLLVWVGLGLKPKVIVAALIAFFPIMTTMASGLRGVERDLRDVARVFGANWWQTLVYLELPRAARSIFAGLKIGAALAVTGAVVGEFVNPDQGLGSLIITGQQNFDTPLMFVAVLSLMFLGASAYALVNFLERRVLQWTE
jgi:NitT/TauT family transport system permease protein